MPAEDDLEVTMPTEPAHPDPTTSKDNDFENWKIQNKEYHDCTEAYNDFALMDGTFDGLEAHLSRWK